VAGDLPGWPLPLRTSCSIGVAPPARAGQRDRPRAPHWLASAAA